MCVCSAAHHRLVTVAAVAAAADIYCVARDLCLSSGWLQSRSLIKSTRPKVTCKCISLIVTLENDYFLEIAIIEENCL